MAEELVKLHPKEAHLIHLIRTKYRFGKIEISTKDGLPYQVVKTIESELLTGEFDESAG